MASLVGAVDETLSLFSSIDPGILEPKTLQLDAKYTRVQIYTLSDLHADHEKSLEFLQKQPSRITSSVYSVLICAGDIATSIDRLREVFDILRSQYNAVCYVPGNHELWTMGRDKVDYQYTSLSKFQDVIRTASTCGIHTSPFTITSDTLSSIRIVPLYSWYHASWDKEPDLTNKDFVQAEKILPFEMKWSDFRQCKWPTELVSTSDFTSLTSKSTALADAFASLNTSWLSRRRPDEMVISYSHFVPRQELFPEKRYVMEPHLHRVIGSDALEAQIRSLHPQLHIFGHTHIPIDLTLNEVRYVQWPLGYTREASLQCAPVQRTGALCIYDTHVAANAPITTTAASSVYWSTYYREHSRDLKDTTTMSSYLTQRVKEVLRTNYA